MCTINVFGTKYIMLVLCLLSLTSTVNCIDLTRSETLAAMQLKALNHLNVLLGDIQSKIQDSRDTLKGIDLSRVFATPRILSGITTWQPPLAREGRLNVQEAIQFPTKTRPTAAKPTFLNPQRSATSPSNQMYQGIRNIPEVELHHNPKDKLNELSEVLLAAVDNATVLATLTTNATSPGSILIGAIKESVEAATFDPSVEPYVEEIEVDHKGFLSVALEWFCEYYALKDPKHLAAVFRRAEFIVSDLLKMNRLTWMGSPMLSILQKVAMMATESQVDEMKSLASIMDHTLKNRRETLSKEVNELIDYADGMVLPTEGEKLFKVINQFRDFPNITKTGDELCLAIIEAFEKPFRSMGDSSIRRLLVVEANKAFIERYPDLENDNTMYAIHRRHRENKKRKNRKHKSKSYRYSNKQLPNNDAYLYRSHVDINPNDGKHIHLRSVYINNAFKNAKQDKTQMQRREDKRRNIYKIPFREGNVYKDVLSNELVTRKLINDGQYKKVTPKKQFDMIYSALTRKLLYGDEYKATKKIYTDNENQKRSTFEVTESSVDDKQIFDSTGYSQYNKKNTDYNNDHKPNRNRFQIFKQTTELKRFKIVHTGLRRENKRLNRASDTSSDETKDITANVHATDSVDDNNTTNVASKDINEDFDKVNDSPSDSNDNLALRMNIINELIQYNNRLLNLIDFQKNNE